MEMKNFFKRIWNYLFKPKYRYDKYGLRYPLQNKYSPPVFIEPSKEQEKLFESLKPKPKPHTQLFRKHQLQGKIYNIGKSRFRINKKLTETADGRLKYIITKLI